MSQQFDLSVDTASVQEAVVARVADQITRPVPQGGPRIIGWISDKRGFCGARIVPVTEGELIAGKPQLPGHIHGFYGAGQEDTSRAEPFAYDADHPAVLVGTNQGPTPVEFLLHAIAACLTAGLANIAAARGITLRRVSSTVEGDIDLLGILGLSDQVRNGYRQIRVHFDVEGDASPEELAGLVERSRLRSAVYDVLANGTDVQVDVSTR